MTNEINIRKVKQKYHFNIFLIECTQERQKGQKVGKVDNNKKFF